MLKVIPHTLIDAKLSSTPDLGSRENFKHREGESRNARHIGTVNGR
jgi:hypothetical protein